MYVKATNSTVDAWPYNPQQIRRDNPSTSFPATLTDDLLAAWNIYPVTIAPEPSFDRATQFVVDNEAPALVDGVWTLGFTVVDRTAEDLASEQAAIEGTNRQRRNALLAETDYLALSDNTLTAAMSAYRQALRDITTHANWPNLNPADWPVKP